MVNLMLMLQEDSAEQEWYPEIRRGDSGKTKRLGFRMQRE